MPLTNHWAGKGINSYSNQRAIMGTLVVRKLRIFRPARRYAGITEHFYTLFSKHSLGQAWKERGGADVGFQWQDEAKRGSDCWIRWYNVCASETARPQRPNHRMTRWSSLQWQADNKTVSHSFKITMGLKHALCFVCVYVDTQECVCIIKHVCSRLINYFFRHLDEFNINTYSSPYSHVANLHKHGVYLLFDVILHNCFWQMTTENLHCLLVSKCTVCFDNSITFNMSSGVFKWHIHLQHGVKRTRI